MSNSSGGKALKSGVWYTAANFITRGIGFLTMPIFTRLLTKTEIGAYSNFTSWIGILGSIVTLDLYTSVTLAKYEYGDKIDSYIASNLVLGSLATAGCYVLCILFEQQVLSFLSFNRMMLHVFFCYCLVSPALLMLQIKNRLEYKYKFAVSLSLLSVILGTGISFACVLTMTDRLNGRVIGQYFPLILMNIIIYGYFLKKAKNIRTEFWPYALRISLPLILHVLSGHLLSSSDRVMITKICGADKNAYYSVAYSCSMVVSILWSSLNQAWAPWAFEQMNGKHYERMKKASRPYILFFGLIVIFFLLAAPEILGLMGGDSYMAALPVIPPVMAAFVFQFVYSLYVNIETFSKKQVYIAIATTIAALTNIALNFLFIPRFGYIAAAYTTLAGYAVLCIVHFFIVKHLGKAEWYDTRFNILFLIGTLVIMFLTLLLYRHRLIRYALVVFIACVGLVFAVCFREDIIWTLRHRSASKLIARIKTCVRNRS